MVWFIVYHWVSKASNNRLQDIWDLSTSTSAPHFGDHMVTIRVLKINKLWFFYDWKWQETLILMWILQVLRFVLYAHTDIYMSFRFIDILEWMIYTCSGDIWPQIYINLFVKIQLWFFILAHRIRTFIKKTL